MSRPEQNAGFTFDTGALILLERRDDRIRRYIDAIRRLDAGMAIPATVLAQVWRGDPRQHAIAALLAGRRANRKDRPVAEVVSFDHKTALRAGVLCRRSRDGDVVDASVVLCANDRNHLVLTTDPDDLRALDPALTVVAL